MSQASDEQGERPGLSNLLTEEQLDEIARKAEDWRDVVANMRPEDLPEVILFAREGRIPEEQELTDEIVKRGHRLTIVRDTESLSAELDSDAPTGKIVICDQASTLSGPRDTEGYKTFLHTYGRSLMKHKMKLAVLTQPARETDCFAAYGHLAYLYCAFSGATQALLHYWDRVVSGEFVDACGEPHTAVV